MSVSSALTEHLDYVLLLFLRVSGLLISSPIFGRRNVPSMSKVGLCMTLSLVFLMALPAPEIFPSYSGAASYGLIALGELLFGVAMGFVTTAMFNVVMAAGSIIDTQIGFSMVNIYDPQNNTQVPVSGSLFNIVLIVLFFGMDGHLRLIDILFATVKTVPVGRVMMLPDIAWVAAEVMSETLTLTVMMAMPMIAAGLLVEAALGAIIRTVPQMNMFVVGIPHKIIIGLLVLIGTLTIFGDFSRELTEKMFDFIEQMFAYIRSAV